MSARIMMGVATGTMLLLGLGACDTTYTPSLHHQDAAATGSMLSGVDTGVNGNDDIHDPSIKTNAGGANTGH